MQQIIAMEHSNMAISQMLDTVLTQAQRKKTRYCG